MALNLGLIENQDFGMINDACLTELTPEWVDENGEGRCTVEIWFKLFRMTLHIASVRSISFTRINCFGLLVNQFIDYS